MASDQSIPADPHHVSMWHLIPEGSSEESMGDVGPQTASGMLNSRQWLKMSLQGENSPESS